MEDNLYKCLNCGMIINNPKEIKDCTAVGEQLLCYQTYLECPYCGGDVEDYEEEEESDLSD